MTRDIAAEKREADELIRGLVFGLSNGFLHGISDAHYCAYIQALHDATEHRLKMDEMERQEKVG